MADKNLITHTLGDKTVLQRESDGYLSATAMCRAAGKKLNDYKRLDNTQEFLKALSSMTGIPAIELVKAYGNNRKMGTWVHPQVAIHLAQWLSPEFAVKVSQWVFDWMSEGKPPITLPNPQTATYDPNEFYLVHKSALNRGGAAVVYIHENYGLTARPIEKDSIGLISAAQAFIQQAKMDGYLLIKPDELMNKLVG